ncbi:MAG TPA: hypothetical protein VIN93_05985 [Bryobacteraceae bacterium]|jgi:hypothetical protein
MRLFRTKRFRLPLLAGGLVVALAVASFGCKREPKTVKVVATEGEAPSLASVVRTSATSQEPQLLNGFYGIENNSWRWTAKQFSVLLRTPLGAAQSGARLNLAFTIPQVAIDHAKTLALSASVEGTPLPPETYSKSGQYEYKRDVPAAALNKEAVRIQFFLDKSIPPSGADRRELGIIVASIGLEPK